MVLKKTKLLHLMFHKFLGPVMLLLSLPILCHGGLGYGILLEGMGGYQKSGEGFLTKQIFEEGYILSGIFNGDISFTSKHIDFFFQIDTEEISEATLKDNGEIYFVDVRLKKHI